ncbi:MAG: hypothetical protein J2P37_04700 [Ktedonobacteraceae bacterium]|nr:hypothetical protein [Ktedonobacteraceae bacterium]MBO0793989.1 hypothetical protein [Ktedonobacteraceae bacterium]
MDVDDFAQPEVGIAALVTATIFSPRVRRFLRRGLVYGAAGALMAGDAVTSFTRGMRQGARRAKEATSQEADQASPSVKGSGGS